MKKALKCLSLLMAALMVFSLAACGAPAGGEANSSDSAASGTQQSTASSAGSQAPVTLTFTHMFPAGDTEGNAIAFRKSLDKFKSENPNITINEEPLSHDNYETKVRTLAAGNELPDIFIVKGSMTSMFIENKLINPVDDVINSDPEWKEAFLQGAFDDFVVDGKSYGIPFQMLNTHLIYYNKKLFNDAGITAFPSNWSEFTDAINKLKAKGIIPISLGNKGNWVAESCILSTLGDRYTGTDWFKSIKEKKGAKFTDPEFISALKALQDLAKMDAFNTDLNSIDNMQQKTAYYNGKAAMFMEGNWAISNVINDAPKDILDNTELALLPAVDGGKGDAMANSAGAAWAYNVNSELKGDKLAAAYKILKAVTDADYATVSVESNAFPASKPKNIDKSRLAPLSIKYLDLAAKIKPVPIYDAQLSADLIQVMNTGLQELLIDGISPEDLAKKIQAEYEK
ncbi:extracellular solute-binding protein [Ruminiclostridium cellobioparum]|uniref:extracellular solute-binding protein n=1 Tax=Ruminiclostridium cellobioparum TaxID=29355 RepID=UPI00048784E5|nr:extracellular solute-binding protein [Ruminiclostridium cellobioparum]